MSDKDTFITELIDDNYIPSLEEEREGYYLEGHWDGYKEALDQVRFYCKNEKIHELLNNIWSDYLEDSK